MMLLRKTPRVRKVLASAGVLTQDHMGKWPPNIQRQDLSKPLPFADGAAQAAYSSHMLEHLFFEDATAFVNECHRVLAPGAIMRLALPDAEQFARALVEAGEDPGGQAGLEYNVMLRAHPESKPKGKRLITFVGGSNFHRWQPTRGLVRMLLENAGFTSVRECTFLNGNLPDLSAVELREDSMFFEGVRTA